MTCDGCAHHEYESRILQHRIEWLRDDLADIDERHTVEVDLLRGLLREVIDSGVVLHGRGYHEIQIDKALWDEIRALFAEAR
jgi:hypothetical protein